MNPFSAESSIYKVIVAGKKMTSEGAGVLIARNKILTNCHILKDNPGWPEVKNWKTDRRYRVTKYVTLGNLDACVLIGGFEGRPLKFTTEYQAQQNVWNYGYPQNIPSIGQGVILGMVNDKDMGPVIKSSLFCWPGTSGGPLLDVQANIVGLNYGYKNNDRNKCISIPAGSMLPLLKTITY
jgi:V8-like Glu-specific endopeptidase